MMKTQEFQKRFPAKVKKAAIAEVLQNGYYTRTARKFGVSRLVLAHWILAEYGVRIPKKPPRMGTRARKLADQKAASILFRKSRRLHEMQGAFGLNKVSAVIESVLIVTRRAKEPAAREVAFHMGDWAGDLRDFFAFCQQPGYFTSEEAGRLLTNFLVHVPEHVAAARKLLLGDPVRDIFEVGAVSEKLLWKK